MYNIKPKIVIGLIALFSFEWVAQASTPVSRAVTASKELAERKAFQARVMGDLGTFGDTAKSPLSPTRGCREEPELMREIKERRLEAEQARKPRK